MSKRGKNPLFETEKLYSSKSIAIVLYCGSCLKEIEKKMLYLEVIEDGPQFDRKDWVTIDPSVLPTFDKCPACLKAEPMYQVIIPKQIIHK